jgi:hypothetical protein
VRKQYHFRPGAAGLDAWDVDRLVALVEDVPAEDIRLEDIREVETDYWFGDGSSPTIRNLVGHLRLIQEVDMAFPILVDPDGGVMDGMHRVARALLRGQASIKAKRLPMLPEPDFVDCQPDDLPY